jgi:hypothetical protein
VIAAFVVMAGSGQAAAPVSPARLLRGPDAVRGLPFFGPNAIAALRGEYDLGVGHALVWSCRGAVVLGAAWKAAQAEAGSSSRPFLLAGAERTVFALVADRYVLFVELPADLPATRRFAFALDRDFHTFFENAPTDAELSFPAFVEYRP